MAKKSESKATTANKKLRGGVSKKNAYTTMSSPKAKAGRSVDTGRSSYVKAHNSIWTMDKDRSVNERKKRNKESVKLTPKQMKDARVKTNQVKPNTFGKVYYNTSKNGTQIKASYVFADDAFGGDGRKERKTIKGKPYTGTQKPTQAKISSDGKNRRKNAANKLNTKSSASKVLSKVSRVGGKAFGGKIGLAITAGSLAKGVYDNATKKKKVK